MAFLCPVRIRRGTKKKSSSVDLEKELARSNNGVTPGMGRITGSASIETLVRVGIEKEHGLSPDSKMVVLHDFTPCVDDELEVKRGQIVNILYRENDWVYVIGLDTRQEGFIPYSYCTPYNNHLAELAIKKKLPREGHVASGESLDTNNDCDAVVVDTSDCDSLGKKDDTEAASPISIHSEPDMIPFSKDPSGRFIVLYTFIARDENDVSVERGEFVTVLNREDPDWYWIVRSDGQEGFIPSGFVYPADNVIQGHLNSSNQNGAGSFPNPANPHSLTTSAAEDLRFHGTELVMLYDYKAQAPDDLTVRRGDWIYADLNNQTVDGWLWAYAPKTRKYGFIPKAYARPPAMTSL
ncbi:dachs ligand with SH3s [Leptinotarsa decemlineata]|uniref:dachs ligand with SH3s n=1 Tax=Leptinotarsa decemlineata TaxID=7539 RepID=UPI003D30CFAA